MLAPSVRAQVFRNDKGHRFKLGVAAVAQMTGYAQGEPEKHEAGGILLGRYILDCKDVVVDRVTVPAPGDRMARFRFFRSAHAHQQAIYQAWRASEGTCNYLGEWHTHPQRDPKPSLVDILEWCKKLWFDQFDSDFLHFVIVGTVQIAVWQGYKKTLRIEKLHRVL